MRKHNYIIGYKGEGQVVYGKEGKVNIESIELLNLQQAKRDLKKLSDEPKAIYKLVEVKE